ncbi:MAG: hypothetical protein ABJP45_12885 [Cyclobacteriaceae bacterium]
MSVCTLLGCSDIDNCTSDSNTSFMIVTFFDIETKESKKVGFRVSATGNASLFGLSTDSLAIGLPLDPQDTAGLFLFDSDTNDYSLQVRYDANFSLFDPDCDPSLFFSGLDTLSTSFDSTAIIGTVTNRQLTTNIEVYF